MSYSYGYPTVTKKPRCKRLHSDGIQRQKTDTVSERAGGNDAAQNLKRFAIKASLKQMTYNSIT